MDLAKKCFDFKNCKSHQTFSLKVDKEYLEKLDNFFPLNTLRRKRARLHKIAKSKALNENLVFAVETNKNIFLKNKQNMNAYLSKKSNPFTNNKS